jgi:hypothetical protein
MKFSTGRKKMQKFVPVHPVESNPVSKTSVPTGGGKRGRRLIFSVVLSLSIFLRGLVQPAYASSIDTKKNSETIAKPYSKRPKLGITPIIATTGGIVLAKNIFGKKRKKDIDMLEQNKEKLRSLIDMRKDKFDKKDVSGVQTKREVRKLSKV